jgi:hypothetical protein
MLGHFIEKVDVLVIACPSLGEDMEEGIGKDFAYTVLVFMRDLLLADLVHELHYVRVLDSVMGAYPSCSALHLQFFVEDEVFHLASCYSYKILLIVQE